MSAAQPETKPALVIDLAALPRSLRQPIWDWMLEHRPEVCEFLGGDLYAAFRDRLDAHALLSLNQDELDGIMAVHPGITRYAA